MKDLPHHIKKLNRRIVRSTLREEAVEGAAVYPHFLESAVEKRKKEKQKIRQERLEHIPVHPSQDERNRQMKHRVPIFDRNSAKPKVAKPTKKKTPRI